jgi:guanylate kinase
VEYHFVDDPTFDRMEAAGDFLEWARVHGRRYGSSRANVEALQARGIDVLFDIDVQGGFQIRRAEPGARLIFVLPPSLPELLRRLRERRTEDEEQVRVRMRASLWELEQGRGYDSFVINDDLERALEALDEIRRSETTPNGDPGGREHLESLIHQGASMGLVV